MRNDRSDRRWGIVAALSSLPLLAGAAEAQIAYQGTFASACTMIPTGGATQNVNLVGGSLVAGQTAIIAVSQAANLPLMSVTDTGGNTWVSDMSAAPSFRTFAVSSRITTGVPNGTPVQMTFGNSTGSNQTTCASLLVFSGLSTSPGYVDQTGSANGSVSPVSVSTAGATTQSSELLLGIFTLNGTTAFTLGVGFTAASAPCNPANNYCVEPEFKILGSTGTQTANGTISPNAPWGGIVVTYKANCVNEMVAPVVTAPSPVAVSQTVCQ